MIIIIINNNNDVDCFPRQDKQPVFPQQDISPTDTLPSLIESTTDTPTDSTDNKNKNDPSGDDDNDDDDVNCFLRQDRQDTQPNLLTKQQRLPFSFPAYTHNPTQAPCKLPTQRTRTKQSDNNNNIRRATPARTKQTAYRRTKPPTHTVVPQAPLLVWDGTQYQLDYNDDHRPISTWDGTTHTDIMYDDDDDYNGTNDYAYGDPFNMNDSSNQLQLIQCLKTVQFQKRIQAVQHIDNAKHTQAVPQHDPPPSKHTTMKHTHKDPQPPYTYDTLQLMFLTTHYDNTKDYADEFPLYTVPHYITRKKNPSHDNYLYQRWTNTTARSKKTRNRKTNQRSNLARSTTKDDPSVTPTLSTLDTCSSHTTNIDTNTILSITIWNKPIVQYKMPIRPNTRNRSREHLSTAVRYALIGVYDKILNPYKLPCLLPLFTRIICVVLSCFLLFADSFTTYG